MKISISNIAWRPEEEKKIFKLLEHYRIDGIDIAPSLVWDNPTNVSRSKINNKLGSWFSEGIEIVALQSLLYGYEELKLFGDRSTRKRTFERLSKLIILASKLKAKALVFGSPKNRQMGPSLSYQRAMDIAEKFFFGLGVIASKNNVVFCIEPNPSAYGCNFIVDHKEALDIVKRVDNSGFRLNIDTSTMTINKEDLQETLATCLPWAGNFHISEPYLEPIGSGKTEHELISSILKDLGYRGWVSIEMRSSYSGDNIDSIKKSIEYVQKVYG